MAAQVRKKTMLPRMLLKGSVMDEVPTDHILVPGLAGIKVYQREHTEQTDSEYLSP